MSNQTHAETEITPSAIPSAGTTIVPAMAAGPDNSAGAAQVPPAATKNRR